QSTRARRARRRRGGPAAPRSSCGRRSARRPPRRRGARARPGAGPPPRRSRGSGRSSRCRGGSGGGRRRRAAALRRASAAPARNAAGAGFRRTRAGVGRCPRRGPRLSARSDDRDGRALRSPSDSSRLHRAAFGDRRQDGRVPALRHAPARAIFRSPRARAIPCGMRGDDVDHQDLLVEKDGHVLSLTLNRPERMNALSHNLLKVELPSAFRRAREDGDVRVVIVTGAGEKAFCSGADLKDAAETGSIGGTQGPSQGPYYRGTPTDFMRAGFDKPVIVAVNGMCLGAGLHFVADADLAICADHATFFDTHVRVGQVFALEAIGLLRRAPFGEVMRMMLLSGAERIDADRALRIGLVTEVVPRAELLARARQIAATIAEY